MDISFETDLDLNRLTVTGNDIYDTDLNEPSSLFWDNTATLNVLVQNTSGGEVISDMKISPHYTENIEENAILEEYKVAKEEAQTEYDTAKVNYDKAKEELLKAKVDCNVCEETLNNIVKLTKRCAVTEFTLQLCLGEETPDDNSDWIESDDDVKDTNNAVWWRVKYRTEDGIKYSKPRLLGIKQVDDSATPAIDESDFKIDSVVLNYSYITKDVITETYDSKWDTTTKAFYVQLPVSEDSSGTEIPYYPYQDITENDTKKNAYINIGVEITYKYIGNQTGIKDVVYKQKTIGNIIDGTVEYNIHTKWIGFAKSYIEKKYQYTQAQEYADAKQATFDSAETTLSSLDEKLNNAKVIYQIKYNQLEIENTEDVMSFLLTQDAIYTVYHIIIPTQNWINRQGDTLFQNHKNGVYYYNTDLNQCQFIISTTTTDEGNGETTVTEYSNVELDTMVNAFFEELNSNSKNDVFTFAHDTQTTMSLSQLHQCIVNLSQAILEHVGCSKCKVDVSDLVYKRDILQSALNVLNYCIDLEHYEEAQRILDWTHKCGGICSNNTNSDEKRTKAGCNCY